MTPHRRVLSQLTSLIMAIIIGASTVAPGLAVTPARPPQLPPPGDDAQRAYHDQTGKLRFLAAQPGSAIAIPGAQEATTVEGRAMAALSVYAQEFGLSNPAQELQVLEAPVSTSSPSFVSYQQVYQGIPVLAGEMIVSTDETGNLLSMSGEVSPEPSLSVAPDIPGEQARATALEAVAKWHELTPADLTATEPELWIYDERLLKPSARPVELVWRMEVTAADLQPIDELVLVNAHTGGISLHFNQIDAAWGEGQRPPTANVMLAPTTYYVATTGNDANSCTTTGAPCATINGAIGKAAASGDTIKVAVGTYAGTGEQVVLVDKNVALSGGWNTNFATQTGMSIVDAQAISAPVGRRGIVVLSVTASIDHFIIQNGLQYEVDGAGIVNSGTLTLNNSAVVNNSILEEPFFAQGPAEGVGIASSGTLIINNSTISGNYSDYVTSGGGISSSGTLTIYNSTITNNTAEGGSGIYGSATLINSILAGNTPSYGTDCLGSILSLGYNIIGTSNVCTFTPVIGDYTNVNVNLGPLDESGGYHPLLSGSWAINAGNPVGCSGSNGPLNTDQRGIYRIGRCDIGAYEYNSPGVSAVGATPQTTLPRSAFPVPLQVLVIDNSNNPVSNALVTFTAPSNGPSGAFANTGTFITTSITNSSGVATASAFTANSMIGSYLVTASVSGFPTPATFQLNNIQSVFTYTANNTTTLPGILLCNQNQSTCTNGINPHADAAHKYALDTFSFYLNNHNRNSIDSAGMAITSTVHYGTNYANAFWSGQYQQMVYGDAYGFSLADDVVAHELTHGVTDYESNLFYYYQSGAINESFSDVWGEFVDLTNGAGNDSAAVRWKMGEDVSGLGALRDMKNPPAFGDPDKMTSSLYYKGAGDNGGVHTNSGVNNKAVYLMTDGGTFNGKTVAGLGIPKVAAIYYKVQTDLLTSGADYADLYYALSQACANLVGGPQGITNEDCQAVRDAADAVQMNLQPSTGFNPEAALCPAGMGTDLSTQTLFFDNMESVTTNWTFGSFGFGLWNRVTGFAASGAYSLYGSNSAAYTDSYAAMSTGASNNIGALPANAFLHFKHAFGFEDYATFYYDGGVLEYSTDNGSSWTDARPLFSDGKNYGGKIVPTIYYGNSLGGRDAFVADSHGYVSSRYNLSSLAGQSARFRWRTATDNAYYDWGWFVDDVRIYTCAGVPGIPSLLAPAANSLTTDYTPTLDWADSTPGLDHYQIQVDDNIAFPSPFIVDQTTASSTFTISTPLNPASTYYWRVRAFNTGGFSSDWSPVRILYTAVVPPTINFPASSVTPPTARPLFDWANTTGATSYTLQISTQQNFSTFVLNQNISPSAYVMPTDLPRNTLLFWRVRANGAHGSGDWSRTRHFFSANPPGVPVLVSPAHNATVTLPPTLDWNDSSPAADYYEVQISTVSTFATFLGRGFSGRAYQSNYTPQAALSPGTPFFWRVRAVNAANQFSQWSASRSFTTPP